MGGGPQSSTRTGECALVVPGMDGWVCRAASCALMPLGRASPSLRILAASQASDGLTLCPTCDRELEKAGHLHWARVPHRLRWDAGPGLGCGLRTKGGREVILWAPVILWPVFRPTCPGTPGI